MAFPSSEHVAPQAGSFQPQTTNLYQLEIHGLSGTDKDFVNLSLSKVGGLKASNAAITIPYGNEERHVAGMAKFDPISLEVRDYLDRETREAITRWRKQVYDVRTGKGGYARDYKKQGSLIMTGPDGEARRTIKLYGLWPEDESFGDFEMSESPGQVLLTVTLRADRYEYIGKSAA